MNKNVLASLVLAALLVCASPAFAALDPFANFAKGRLVAGINNTATSITLVTGDGARFPAASFNATIWNATDYADPSDDPSREIVRVTAVVGDVLTITRGLESTAAANHNTAGKAYKITAAITAKTLNTDIPAMSITGNAATATALAATPTGCAANQFATAIAASGNLTCATPAAANITNAVTTDTTQTISGAKTFSNSGGMNVTANVAGTLPVFVENTNAANAAMLQLKSGDGTNSSQNEFVAFFSNKTVTQHWQLGMIGSTTFQVTDVTAGRTPFSVAHSDGTVTFSTNASFPSGGITINGAVGGSYGVDQVNATGNVAQRLWANSAAGISAITMQSGDGTTSARQSYVEQYSNEASSQNWHLGMQGSKNWTLQDVTGTRTPITVAQSNGLTTFGNGLATGRAQTATGFSPTCTVTNAGTGATCVITAGSSDYAGTVQINTGTGPLAVGVIVLTFSTGSAYGTNTPVAISTPSNNGAQTWNPRATITIGASTTTSVAFNWDNNAVSLTGSSNYQVNYMVVAK